MTYGFEKGKIPESYERIDWTMRQERTNKDYGPPDRSNGPEVWDEFKDWERSPEHQLATIF